MQIEIDQSGRLDFSGPSFFAFSNSEKGVLYVSQEIKNKVDSYYQQSPRFSKETMRKRVKVRFFVACMALLLKQAKLTTTAIIVDDEFSGYAEYIKQLLENRLNKSGSKIKVNIEVGPVGKKSPAHKLAKEVRDKRRKPNLIASFEDLLTLL